MKEQKAPGVLPRIPGNPTWNGDDLKRARTRARLTQQGLANELSVARTTVARWESGQSTPSKRHQKLIVRVLKIRQVPKGGIERTNTEVSRKGSMTEPSLEQSGASARPSRDRGVRRTIHKAGIKPAYSTLRSLYLGATARDSGLRAGRVTVVLQDDRTGFTAEGKLDERGLLSGMAPLYSRLGLKDGATVKYEVMSAYPKQQVVSILDAKGTRTGTRERTAGETVFARVVKNPLYIEPFRPENLEYWSPETEPDVYMAFGVLQDYTDYKYCCGASKALLDSLGVTYGSRKSKPDAILYDRSTKQYVIAEWKKSSSEFTLNHHRSDVDVLVCWLDDEPDKAKLPEKVVELKALAQQAARESFEE